MSNQFFEKPVLNAPYGYPSRHWELDESGQPTQKILETRRRAQFITPIPKPKKRKSASAQNGFVFDEGAGLSTKEQQYDPTSIINEVRGYVGSWRSLPNPNQWQVTPETARLLQHWRHHKFSGVRPFFCQVDAVEKKSTMDTYWVPGVNHFGTYGRWAFAEFTEVYQIEADFAKKVEAEFNKMIASILLTTEPVTARQQS